jgi:hypothetical protein
MLTKDLTVVNLPRRTTIAEALARNAHTFLALFRKSWCRQPTDTVESLVTASITRLYSLEDFVFVPFDLRQQSLHAALKMR